MQTHIHMNQPSIYPSSFMLHFLCATAGALANHVINQVVVVVVRVVM